MKKQLKKMVHGCCDTSLIFLGSVGCFGQKEVTTKDFYGQRKITDIFTIDINKLVVSDKVPCNNGKNCHYIVDYQVDGVLVPLFIKTPKKIFSYGVSQYDKNSAYTMSFNVSEEKE